MFKVYNLGISGDRPGEDRKVAVFYDCAKAIDYVEYMAVFGERYGVFDASDNRLDEE